MGRDDNVAIMQRAYDAFNTADLDTLVEIFDESIVWHLPGESYTPTTTRAETRPSTYFGQLAEETNGTFRAEIEYSPRTMTAAWSASSAAPGIGTASIWMSATASSSSSRTAGSSTVASTSTTSTRGTSSGRNRPRLPGAAWMPSTRVETSAAAGVSTVRG